MEQQFSSSADFLLHLQKHWARPIFGAEQSPEFEKIIAAQAKDAKLDFDLLKTDGLDRALRFIVSEVMPKFPGDSKGSGDVAIGTLDAGTINARIVRSKDGRHAIVIHRGLMLLIHKFVKHLMAWGDPSEVEYCNRLKEGETLTAEQAKEWLFELLENTKKHNAPYGALYHLKDEARVRQSYAGHIMEMFVLCHELGHLINGDLNGDAQLKAFESCEWVDEYVENESHGKEFSADATAFKLMIEVLNLREQSDQLRVMPPIILLFNMMFMFGARGSNSHPDPISRCHALFAHFFDSETAEKFALSYKDLDHLRDIFAAK